MRSFCTHDCIPKCFNPTILLQKHTCRWCGHVLTEQEVADRAGLNDPKPTAREIQSWNAGDDDDSEV
jgi:hypothetical protein